MTDSDPQAGHIAALIELPRCLPRKGPGDEAFSLALLDSLPALPPHPRIADLGCGSGAATLLLARYYSSKVIAVDFAVPFIEELEARTRETGLDLLVAGLCADMGRLDWTPASLDLIWSEGAAYALGFENALALWRPFLADGGIAVVSELSWFDDAPPAAVRDYWQTAYPDMGSEAQNVERARRAGYRVLETRRLPSEAWWKSYYDPLRERMPEIEPTPANQAVLRETEEEMAQFESWGEVCGYTFYVLQANV
jgi:SAM-dependent methyltransferase